jgi:hypothetical protein
MARSRLPDVIRYYFKISPSGGDRAYSCNKCATIPKITRSTGYTNLRRHLRSYIGDDDEKHTTALKSQENSLGFQVTGYVTDRELVIFK